MFKSVAFRAFISSTLIVLAGCSSNPEQADTNDFSQRSRGLVPLQATRLAPGDAIDLSVEVDGKMEIPRLRADINYQGLVTLPLVGDVKIGGLDIDIARSVIAMRYSSFYVSEPVIMVSLVDDGTSAEWGQVRVLGKVNRPGSVPLASASGINLSSAIQEAGGFAPSAKTTEIQITRPRDSGAKLRVTVNFNEIGEEGNAEADIMLFDGDIVYIPERIF